MLKLLLKVLKVEVSELVVELSVNVTVEEDDKLVTIKVPALTTVLPVKVFEDEDKLIVPAPSLIKPEATALGKLNQHHFRLQH